MSRDSHRMTSRIRRGREQIIVAIVAHADWCPGKCGAVSNRGTPVCRWSVLPGPSSRQSPAASVRCSTIRRNPVDAVTYPVLSASHFLYPPSLARVPPDHGRCLGRPISVTWLCFSILVRIDSGWHLLTRRRRIDQGPHPVFGRFCEYRC